MEDSFAVVLPYYNEAAYLRPTLVSLLSQTRPADQLILVDNGSTDCSQRLCRELVRDCARTQVIHLSEARPGKIHALALAQTHIRSTYVAFVDADTYYPPHYLATSERLFRAGGTRRVAVMAKDLVVPAHTGAGIWNRWFYAALARVLYWQTFAGGCGHMYRTEAFRAVGGFSVERWKYTLEDHEIMNRLRRFGTFCYHPEMWCLTSTRRRDRTNVGWNTFEQLVYLCTPPAYGDWFFNRFLAARFEKRHIYQTNLREQDWNESAEEPAEFSRAA